MPHMLNSRSVTLVKGRLAYAISRLRHRFLGATAASQTQTLKAFQKKKRETVDAPNASPARGRKRDLNEHLQLVRQDLSGKSELCYLHAELVVKIRRGIDPAATLECFFLLWKHENEHLTEHLNSRWLISALDTFADYGSPIQRALALMQIAFFNTIKLAETEHIIFDERPDKTSLTSLTRTEPVPIWDGMESFNVVRGDMLRNMLERMQRAASVDRTLARIFDTLLSRARASNNLLSRMMAGNRFFQLDDVQ